MSQQVIKTNIKFKKNEKGVFQGFVTKNEHGSWRGCREDADVSKKIVLLNPRQISIEIKENTLYQCSLIPMKSDCGYIVISAKQVQFEAKTETVVHENVYRVMVKFGNKIVTYDPTSKQQKRNDIQSIADFLRSREDLKYANAVAEEFLDCACLLQSIYNRNKNGD